jgi:hypothetical protein
MRSLDLSGSIGDIGCMFESDDPDGYVVTWSLRALFIPAAIFVTGVGVLVAVWPGPIALWLGLAVIFALSGWVAFVALRRIIRGTVAFAVDSRGIYLGDDDELRRPTWVYWESIDSVVHFRSWNRDAEEYGSGKPYVGIVRNGKIIDVRLIQGWKLDIARLTRATQHFGGDTLVQKLPDQNQRSLPRSR